MKTIAVGSRVALFVSAIVLLLEISPALAAEGDHGGRVEVTFTKWVLSGGAGPFMAGFTGGDVEGAFLGEVFANVPSLRIPSRVNRLEVIYEIQADDENRSFTALLRGGQGKPEGIPLGSRAFLDGRILLGWRTGAQVHAEWVAMEGPVNCPSPPAGAGPRCFVGTITIERPDHDDDKD
jgi:hypothetical protein